MFLEFRIAIDHHIDGDALSRLIKHSGITDGAAILPLQLGQLTTLTLVFDARARASTNDVETTLTIRLPEQRRPRVAPIPNEHRSHPSGQGGLDIREKHFFQLILAARGLFLPRILESVNRQRQGPALKRDSCEQSLCSTRFGLVEENRPKSPTTGTKNEPRQSVGDATRVQARIAQEAVQTLLARMRSTGRRQHPKQSRQGELAVPAAYRSEHAQKGHCQNRQVLLHGTAQSRESLAYRRIQQRQ